MDKILKTLGLQTAFNKEMADFTAISTRPDMYISDVLHKAMIEVRSKK